MKTISTKEDFLNAELSNFSQVYLGKDNACRCGCNDTYTATSFHINAASEEVNDVLVTKRLKRAKNLINSGAEFEIGSNNINIVTGENRAMTFYFDDIKG